MGMEEYAESIKEIDEIRDSEKSENLSQILKKLYRNYVGKINLLT